jgi:hypothetical protein
MRRLYLFMAGIALVAGAAEAATATPPKPVAPHRQAVKPKVVVPPKPVVPQQLVARIDNLIATEDKNNVLIQARGAVGSGGWREARLRAVKADDPHTIVVEFVATPPAPNHAVIEGLLPIHASTSIRLRRGVVSVRVISGSNEITSQILKY